MDYWRALLLTLLATLHLLTVDVDASGFQCTNQSKFSGYRCSQLVIHNTTPHTLLLKENSLSKHAKWAIAPPERIEPNEVGVVEANSDCKFLACFHDLDGHVTYTTDSPSADKESVKLTFHNALDKLLYGCNKLSVDAPASHQTQGLEVTVKDKSHSGCYCCTVAPCDCNSFDNANYYQLKVEVGPVPVITSIAPHEGYADEVTTITVFGSGFVNDPSLSCQVTLQGGSGTMYTVPANFVSETAVTCNLPQHLSEVDAAAFVKVTNYNVKLSNHDVFTFRAPTPGAKAVLDSSLLKTVLHASLPAMTELVKQSDIPAVHREEHVSPGINIVLDLTNIHVRALMVKDVDLSFQNNKLSLSVGLIDAIADMNWAYVDKGTIIKGSGFATDTVHISLAATFGFAASPNGNLQLRDPSVTLSVSKLDIQCEDGGAQFLVSVLKSIIRSQVEKKAKDELTDALRNTFNQQLAALPTEALVYTSEDGSTQVALDLSLLYDPQVEASTITGALNGQFVLRDGEGHETKASRDSHIKLPSRLPTSGGSMLQLMLSETSLNGALGVVYGSGLLSYTLTEATRPPQLPVKLNTDAWDALLPGLKGKYPDMPFDIIVSLGAAPTVKLSHTAASQIVANAALQLEFVVNATTDGQSVAPEVATTVVVDTVLTLNNTNLNDTALSANIADVVFTPRVTYCSWGSYPLDQLNALFQRWIKATVLGGIPQQMLNSGIALPLPMDLPTLGQKVGLQNPELVFGEGYVGVATDIRMTKE